MFEKNLRALFLSLSSFFPRRAINLKPGSHFSLILRKAWLPRQTQRIGFGQRPIATTCIFTWPL